MTRILMIEDDMELAEILTEYLENYDIKVTTAEEPYIGLSTLNTGDSSSFIGCLLLNVTFLLSADKIYSLP